MWITGSLICMGMPGECVNTQPGRTHRIDYTDWRAAMQSTEVEAPARAIVCYGPPMNRIKDEPDGERWCFHCRKRREFRFTVDAPTEPSYYGPNPAIRCGACGRADGDCFPGTVREWEG